MRQCQHKQYLDVQVMRGAECWSDHRMVRARVQVSAGSRRQLDKIKKPNMRILQSEELQAVFDGRLSELLDQSWASCTSLNDKWDSLVTSVKDTAIPHYVRPMADWFLENEHTIRPVVMLC